LTALCSPNRAPGRQKGQCGRMRRVCSRYSWRSGASVICRLCKIAAPGIADASLGGSRARPNVAGEVLWIAHRCDDTTRPARHRGVLPHMLSTVDWQRPISFHTCRRSHAGLQRRRFTRVRSCHRRRGPPFRKLATEIGSYFVFPAGLFLKEPRICCRESWLLAVTGSAPILQALDRVWQANSMTSAGIRAYRAR